MSSEFRVLMVCTANHCRSPLAEQILRRELDRAALPGPGWIVTSAGTDALVGREMHEHARTVLTERGYAPPPFAGRQLTETVAREQDLILVATREHRSKVVALVPAVMNRVFTLKQFARLADAVIERTGADAGEIGRNLLQEARYARSTLQPVAVELEDLQDPIGFPLEAYRSCADEISEAVSAVLGVLGPRPENSHQSSS